MKEITMTTTATTDMATARAAAETTAMATPTNTDKTKRERRILSRWINRKDETGAICVRYDDMMENTIN